MVVGMPMIIDYGAESVRQPCASIGIEDVI